jgi:hypothetical protein
MNRINKTVERRHPGRNGMIRYMAVGASLIVFAAAAGAVTEENWKPVAKALEAIPTAAGMSARERIDRCHFMIEKDASFVETRSVAWPQYDAKAGQTVLQVTLQLPLYKGEPTADNQPVKAVWIVDHGKATPLSRWAISLQNKPIPMGYEKRTQC